VLTTSGRRALSIAGMDTTTLARIALLAPLPAIILEPITASAYFRTSDGKSSADPSWIHAWTTPVQHHLTSLFTWSSAHNVYLTYGKAIPLAFVGMMCALIALRRLNSSTGGRFRWAWPAGVAAYGLSLAGVIGEYWTPWSDASFIALSVPAILLLFAVSPFLGARLLQQGVGSRAGGWMIALSMPGIIGSAALGGHLGFAVIWLSVAWMLHARRLLAVRATYSADLLAVRV
jgi:hypothetical protein